MNETSGDISREGLSVKPLLFIISGPSGSGKKTLLHHIASQFPDVQHVVTFTTRAPRAGEVAEVDYRFVTEAEFTRKAESGEIFEYTRTYRDDLYGSPRRLIDNTDGADLLVELDYKGMFRVRAISPRRVVSIFILPPDPDVLVKRIQGRQQEANLDARLASVREQAQFAWAYDYVLVNDNMDRFREEAATVVQAERLRRDGANLLLHHRHDYDTTL